jgi:hypothetical protein
MIPVASAGTADRRSQGETMYAIAFTTMQLGGLRETQAARAIESLIQRDPDWTLCSRPEHPGRPDPPPDARRSGSSCLHSEPD